MQEFITESYWRKFGQNGDQVMAKFNDHTRHIKDDFFERIRGNRSNNCYISEFFTPRNNAIFYEARKLKKANRNIHSVFTFRGQVYLKLSQNSDGILIRQVSDLRQYILPAPSSLTKLDHPQPNVHQRCLQALILAYPRRWCQHRWMQPLLTLDLRIHSNDEYLSVLGFISNVYLQFSIRI